MSSPRLAAAAAKATRTLRIVAPFRRESTGFATKCVGLLGSAALSLAAASVLDEHVPRCCAAVVPAAGPGEHVLPEHLRQSWQAMEGPAEILPIKGHHFARVGSLAIYSNFYQQAKETPGEEAMGDTSFVFLVPFAFCAIPLSRAQRRVRCDFSEQAIMLCKAAAMGDAETYQAIVASESPREVKALGRKVKNFDDHKWQRIVCSVAAVVQLSKFGGVPAFQGTLRGHLLGEVLAAEMVAYDKNWGTGVEMDSPIACVPSKWPGTNLLGWSVQLAGASLEKGEGLRHLTGLLMQQEAALRNTPLAHFLFFAGLM